MPCTTEQPCFAPPNVLFYSWPASDLTSKCLLSHPSGSAAVSVFLFLQRMVGWHWTPRTRVNTTFSRTCSAVQYSTVQYSTEPNKPATEHLTSSQALQNCEVKPQDNFTCILRLILNFLQNSLATLYGGLLWSWASPLDFSRLIVFRGLWGSLVHRPVCSEEVSSCRWWHLVADLQTLMPLHHTFHFESSLSRRRWKQSYAFCLYLSIMSELSK